MALDLRVDLWLREPAICEGLLVPQGPGGYLPALALGPVSDTRFAERPDRSTGHVPEGASAHGPRKLVAARVTGRVHPRHAQGFQAIRSLEAEGCPRDTQGQPPTSRALLGHFPRLRQGLDPFQQAAQGHGLSRLLYV